MHLLWCFLAGSMTIVASEYIGLARAFVVAAACPVLLRCIQRDWYVNSGSEFAWRSSGNTCGVLEQSRNIMVPYNHNKLRSWVSFWSVLDD
jgi:hypothetical protein